MRCDTQKEAIGKGVATTSVDVRQLAWQDDDDLSSTTIVLHRNAPVYVKTSETSATSPTFKIIFIHTNLAVSLTLILDIIS